MDETLATTGGRDDSSRRTFLKSITYVAPAILTLQARPAFAQRGSGGSVTNEKPKGNNGVGNGEDPQPPGNPPINDGPGTAPGDPGNQGGVQTGAGNGNSGGGNGNTGNANSGSGNSGSGNGNSGKGNSGKGNDGTAGQSTPQSSPPAGLAFNARQPIT